jgi:preprotein translocase subunit SecB
MKKIFSKIASLAMALGLVSLAACSPETYDGVDINGIPQASDIDVTVTVDQETNQYTLTLNNAQGVYPVWTIHTSDTKTEISTRPVYTGIITVAGSYPVEVRLGNRNGISEGSKVYYINIENTLVDFAPYIRRLTNGDSKTWMFASDKSAHLGCGESGTDGTGWWSASPNDKAGTGMYENRFIFSQTTATDGGGYTYDPGTSGTVYVNTGISSLPPYTDYNPGDGNDYSAPASKQDVDFQFKVEGTDLYIEFPAGTLMGYIPNVEAYNSPKFKVNSVTNDNVELTIDNGSIAWHYILGLEGDAPFNGFKYDSDFNMWKKANVQDPVFWYAPGWNQIADPAWSLDGATYTVTLPEATSDQWQAQMLITTDMSTTSANNYDFSVVLNSSLAHPHVTIKLTDATDDGNFYFAEQVALNAYEDYVFYMSDMPGLDIASLKLVFDFGGNEAGSVITMSNIVLKNHADDDGTVLPADNGGEEGGDDSTTWVDVNSADNLWNGVSYTNFFYYAPGWSPIGDPGFVDNNGTYTISLPSATFDQWQAQVHFLTNIATTADKTYDLRIVLNSTQDVAKATIKLCDVEDDGIFYFTDRVNLTAYDDCVFTETGLTGQEIANLKLVFDFGGNPDNTEITISGIILQEHVGE